MKTLLRAMSAFFYASLATMLQYRGELVLWAVWGVVYPAVAMAMWSAAVKGSVTGQAIGGMGPGDFAAYFLLTMIVGHVGAAWDIFEMGYLVRSGEMSPRLLRPLLPMWQSLSDNLAYKLVTLVILVPLWLIVAWVAHPYFRATPTDFLLGVPAVLLGAALNYLWGYNLALSAFWITRMDAISELWWVLNLGLGGRMAPLPIMPAPIQWLAAALPFKWIVWFPAAALAGQLPRQQVASGLGWQILWLAAGLVAFRLIWRAGVRQYSAVGA